MSQFLQELKRRSVIKVAIAYVVAAWVLLQVADLLVPVLSLPDWAIRLVFLLLAVGFVPALIIAWAYEMTPEGVKRDEEAAFCTRETPAGKDNRRVVAAAAGMAVIIAAASYWFMGIDKRWARKEAVPQIEAYVEAGDWESAYSLALDVAGHIPGDPGLEALWRRFSLTTSIPSEPAGAAVYRRRYGDVEGEWKYLGVTPLTNVVIPFGFSELRLELDGHAPITRVVGTDIIGFSSLDVRDRQPSNYAIVAPETYRFERAESAPDGFVTVSGWDQPIDGNIVSFDDYFIGRFEVTNEEYQEFVDAGGYARAELWEHPFHRNGEAIDRVDAMALFVDRTGRPGPSTWEAGSYPDGQGRYPVSGISWYEAAAYARFRGRELPTVHHWRHAHSPAMLPNMLPLSNLQSDNPRPVGESGGTGWTGTYDMVGNVREWIANEIGDQRVIIGGAYDDQYYVAQESIGDPGFADPMDRSPANGMRLAFISDPPEVSRLAGGPIAPQEVRVPEPVDRAIFEVYRSAFDYDPGPLDARIEATGNDDGWTRETITFNAPYSDDRITLYLYVPDDDAPVRQVVMLWPGTGALFVNSFEQAHHHLDFILKNGRAVAYPVLHGTFHRRLPELPAWTTIAGRDLAIRQVKDFRRSIDYLETRPDVDRNSIAYYGSSWGGRLGGIVLAIEPRIKVGVLDQAGINFEVRPEIDVTHFLRHVSQPVLQFNGRYDSDFVFDTSAKPFYDLIGTPEPDKQHVVEPTGHFVGRPRVIGETLNWLDRYLGPVAH